MSESGAAEPDAEAGRRIASEARERVRFEEEALELAASQALDLVVLDVNLPDIDGFEVCRQLRASPRTARTPVIHLSATFVNDVDKVQGLDAGADGYITHPVEPPVLIATVNAFLRRLHGARPHVRHLVRADVPRPEAHRVDLERAQVTVVDMHNLNDRAKRFVVGVVLGQAFRRKERSGQARPLQFVVLDELNKYAPREGFSPIKEILLDVAERGRSLGIVLIGAILVAGTADSPLLYVLAFVAIVLGAGNVFGGFAVTDRMLEMFKKKPVEKLSAADIKGGTFPRPVKVGHSSRWRSSDLRAFIAAASPAAA